ncbi:MAG: F0F1 ATP synthase subunit A [candidate division KSB1 bacterium]|nr:F0F1 ATP synthase subunit A [candidate division KSB1 bacterium]
MKSYLFFSNIQGELVSGVEEPGGGEGASFIMHHIQDQVLVPLPKVLGIDLSITKHVLMMWIAAAILMIALPLILRTKRTVPRGAANFLEAIIVFLKEDVIEPNLGEEGRKYTPYLLTAFFFILTCNLLGLVPMAATATGNIAVTGGLAILTYFMVHLSGIRQHGLIGYLKGFAPKGVPFFVIPILVVVEFLGLLTKHFALAIRLFANMTAGHLVIFTLLSLIFMFKNYFIAPFPIFGILFVSLLEILIALIQAYIFTILSSAFIGMAVHQEH